MNPLRGITRGLRDETLGRWLYDKLTELFGNEEVAKAAFKVVKDSLEPDEAGNEGFSLLMSKLDCDEHEELRDRLWRWVKGSNSSVTAVAARLVRLHRALDRHYSFLKDGVVHQTKTILRRKKKDSSEEEVKADWPDGYRPQEVFESTWLAILKQQGRMDDAIELAVTFFNLERKSKFEKAWTQLREWFEKSPVWFKIRNTASRLTWTYLCSIVTLSVVTILFAGATIHFALEAKSGRTLVFLGITSLLIGFLYTIRYPLQEAWQIATDLVGGGDVSWKKQKATMRRRIAYLAVGALVIFLLAKFGAIGAKPTVLFTGLLALVGAFTLREHAKWQKFCQVVIAGCLVVIMLPNAQKSVGGTIHDYVPEETRTVVLDTVNNWLPGHRFNPDNGQPNRKAFRNPVTGEWEETKNWHRGYDGDFGEKLEPVDREVAMQLETLECNALTMDVGATWQEVSLGGQNSIRVTPIRGCVMERFFIEEDDGSISESSWLENCPHTNDPGGRAGNITNGVIRREVKAAEGFPSAKICVRAIRPL